MWSQVLGWGFAYPDTAKDCFEFGLRVILSYFEHMTSSHGIIMHHMHKSNEF